MSTVKANTFQDASGGSNAVLYGVASPPNSMGFRNRILNGDMRLDQRNAGASISVPGGDGNYCLDRWRLQRGGGAGTMTVQQVTSAPTGFSHAIKFTVTGSSTPAAGDYYTVGQLLEGFNTADLAWGTASAQNITLSFWINSSVTGTYSASIYNWGGTSNAYPATFTVNAANTWEYKTVTIPGATSGTWPTNNTGSFYFRIDLGSGANFSTATANAWNTSGLFRTNGSVNFISNASATLLMTGVQLEAGSVATPFERIDYGRQLAMCQRYYEKSYDIGTAPGTGTTTSRVTTAGNAGATTTGYIEGYLGWKVNKRGAPTVTIYDMAGASGKCTRLSTGIGTSNNQTVATSVEGETGCSVFSSGSASGNCLQLHYTASSEL